MDDNSPLRVPRGNTVTLAMADDEHAFLLHVSHTLGVSIASVVRDALIGTLMTVSDSEALFAARHNHVTSMARIDKWRKQRAPVAAPPSPARIPLI